VSAVEDSFITLGTLLLLVLLESWYKPLW
jgi:hypothetical protein